MFSLKRILVVRCALLFYLFTFLPLSISAEDVVRMGCRRGTYPSTTPTQRSLMQRRGGADPKYIGNRRQLVVLAEFKNRAFKGNEAATIEQWDKIFNAENFTEAPFVGSVHDYFDAQSYGQFNVTFDLHYVALADSLKKYRSRENDDELSQYLVDDVVDTLQNRAIDWSPYDWDGDGYIDQIVIVYAGKGSSYGGLGGGYDAIWPHQWWLSKHLDQKTGWYRSYRTVSSGGQEYKVDCYCALQELYTDGSYGTFGTICHEYSHCFGLPDFYYNGSIQVVSEWDLMDNGNYNGGGYRPCGYSAHERMLMGWLTPIKVTDDIVVSGMPALSDEPQAYILHNDAHEDEYYMVENRQQRGWDTSLPGSGIVIFHVDYNKEIWEGTDEWANNDNIKRYSIFPANNKTSTYSTAIAGWAYPNGDNNELTNTSSPAATLNHLNTDSTKFMSKPITGMMVTDGLASFTVKKEPTAVRQQSVDTSPKVLYDLGPVLIIRTANGEIKKVMKH